MHRWTPYTGGHRTPRGKHARVHHTPEDITHLRRLDTRGSCNICHSYQQKVREEGIFVLSICHVLALTCLADAGKCDTHTLNANNNALDINIYCKYWNKYLQRLVDTCKAVRSTLRTPAHSLSYERNHNTALCNVPTNRMRCPCKQHKQAYQHWRPFRCIYTERTAAI